MWLLSFKNPQGQLARWLEELAQYNMTIKHRAGSKHQNADALSRIPVGDICNNYKMGYNLEKLTCKGCMYCQRVHKNWSCFAESVDDVLPSVGCRPSPEQLGINQSMTDLYKSEANKVLNISTGDLGPLEGWGYTAKQLTEFQNNEEPLKLIVAWCREGNEPPEGVLFRSSPATKHIWLNKETFLIKNGLLWKKSPQSSDLRFVVHDALKREIMVLNHEIPMGGHQGIIRTKDRMKMKFYWYNMDQDIQNYVASCSLCNKYKKPTRKNRSELQIHQSGSPLEGAY